MTLLAAAALALVTGMGGAEGLEVSATTAAPGDTIIVSGAECAPDSDVNLSLDGSILARTRSDATGAFLTPVTFADGVADGPHTLTAIGLECGMRADVTVESPAPEESDASDTMAAAAILLVAVVISVTIVVASRRRWPDEATQADSD